MEESKNGFKIRSLVCLINELVLTMETTLLNPAGCNLKDKKRKTIVGYHHKVALWNSPTEGLGAACLVSVHIKSRSFVNHLY